MDFTQPVGGRYTSSNKNTHLLVMMPVSHLTFDWAVGVSAWRSK